MTKRTRNKHTVCNLTSKITESFMMGEQKFFSSSYVYKKQRLSFNISDMIEGDTITIENIVMTYVGKHRSTGKNRHILYDFDIEKI